MARGIGSAKLVGAKGKVMNGRTMKMTGRRVGKTGISKR